MGAQKKTASLGGFLLKLEPPFGDAIRISMGAQRRINAQGGVFAINEHSRDQRSFSLHLHPHSNPIRRDLDPTVPVGAQEGGV